MKRSFAVHKEVKLDSISLLSHQLRSPISNIRLYTELLLDKNHGKLDANQRKYVLSISKINAEMLQLVEKLLVVSRIEEGKIVINPEFINLKDVVTDVLKESKVRISRKGHKVVTQSIGLLPKVNVDPVLIKNVYFNFLDNAIKYTPPKGKISVHISRDGDEIITRISDTGYGIPKEEQYKLFQKFHRGSHALHTQTEGSGLGLYIAKTIIESFGGKVWFQSEENKGTTFWFSLPVR